MGARCAISSEANIRTKPNLSALALISFISSFAIARTFSTLYPNVVLVGGDFHIHHFWYGLAMLAIAGWLGISVESARVNRVAAILFGAGGGLIGDEIGLLLTFESQNYWTGVAFTFVIIVSALASVGILLARYRKVVMTEFGEFLSSNASLYVGVFLAAVSIAFISETDNTLVITLSSLLTIAAVLIIFAYLVQRVRTKR